MADPKHPSKFEEGSRRQIVQPCDNGKPLCEIMSEYDLGRSTVSRWARRIHDSGSTRAEDNRTPEQNRIIEPGRENRQLRMEAGVSRTAAPMFARR